MELKRRDINALCDRLVSAERRFADDEDGSVTIFACFMIAIMVLVGGIGVDMMRHEMERTQLQATADRAVLAAADLDQTLDPEAVVRDYFEKSGMGDYVSSVNVDEGLNYRTVSVDATNTVSTQFMDLLGVPTLDVPAFAEAEEKVNKVEISLVLDISGSMGRNSRIQNLRPAAKEFVNTVLKDESEDLISVSIVPYSAHVNAGPEIMSRMNMNIDHNYSHCVEFDDNQFSTTGLDWNNTYDQMQHFARWNPGYNDLDETVCPRFSYERITALSQDRTALNAQIDNLQPRANTSIFLGMKWASILLDPSFNQIAADMADDNLIDDVFSNRPAAYSDPETFKTVILMTDGQNVATDRIQNWYYNSNSEIVHWNRYNAGWYVDNYVGWRYRNNFFYQKYSASKGDTLLYAVCDAAKAQNIVIWSIGFEVSDHGANVMKNCASSPSHFFRVEGIEISEAFKAIARQINQLRLTL